MSNLIMIYDTETTGKWDFKASYNDPTQPNLIQMGYKVYNTSRDVIFEIGHLVDTTDFPSWSGIEEGAYNAHHIREETVRKYGWSPTKTMELWLEWATDCFMFVGHNEKFDHGIMQCFAQRAGYNPGGVFGNGETKTYCTMMTSTKLCNIPGKYGPKWPKLNEAYPHFFPGETFKNAHNALADVNPTAEIFWKHVDLGHLILEA